MGQNFEQIAPYLQNGLLQRQLTQIEQRFNDEFARQKNRLEQRYLNGQIRECHGDLHLGNIALVDSRACPFDCIEFNPRYRWIDPLNDLAFLLMDLQLRGHPQLANRLLNRYLEQSLDYAGLPLMGLYQSYRALVRAKVALLGSGPANPPASPAVLQEVRRYLNLAQQLLQPQPAQLLLMQGVSGSGKSWLSQRLFEQQPWIRLRSDRLRPQIHQQLGADLPRYGEQVGQATYQHLLDLSQTLLQAGYQVIVDAAFPKFKQRQPFFQLAESLGIPVRLVQCVAETQVLEQRLQRRQQEGKDPSEATLEVLHQQLQERQPLKPEEEKFCTTVNSQDATAVEGWLSNPLGANQQH